MGVEIIYILGTGHSGSTILDIMLGAHRDLVATGEIVHFLEVRRQKRRCSCGELVAGCGLWSKVYESWRARVGSDALQQYPAQQVRFEKLRNIPALLRNRNKPGKDFSGYLGTTVALYESVADVTGSSVIVDSSKNAVRAMAMTQMQAVKVTPLHLVRDSRAVLWSYLKTAGMDVPVSFTKVLLSGTAWRTMLDWNALNLFIERMRRRDFDSSIFVRYEDLVHSPRTVLTQIGNTLGMNMQEVITTVEQEQELDVGHIVAGNAMRKRKALKLSPDFSWRQKMPPSVQRLCRLTTGALARRYQYQ